MTMFRKSLIVIAASGVFGCSHLNESEREQERNAAADQQRQDNVDPRARTTARPQARKGTAATRKQPEAGGMKQPTEVVKPKEPDNTAVNERDRDSARPTPMEQGNSADDIRITANIRKAVMKEDLSFTAKNVKIITQDGHVFLRGPVKSTLEKERIATIARVEAGVLEVENQLEVEFQPNY